MGREQLVDKFEKVVKPYGLGVDVSSTYLEGVLDDYFGLELNPDITDPQVRLLCAALNKFGYETTASCVGHGRILPCIYFECADQLLLQDLAYVIAEHAPTEESWVVELFPGNPVLNPSSNLIFALKPIDMYGLFSSVRERYGASVRDLDVLGVGLMIYFDMNYE